METGNAKSLNEELAEKNEELLRQSRSLLATMNEALGVVIDLRDDEPPRTTDAGSPSTSRPR